MHLSFTRQIFFISYRFLQMNELDDTEYKQVLSDKSKLKKKSINNSISKSYQCVRLMRIVPTQGCEVRRQLTAKHTSGVADRLHHLN